jgi:hypothetical protein
MKENGGFHVPNPRGDTNMDKKGKGAMKVVGYSALGVLGLAVILALVYLVAHTATSQNAVAQNAIAAGTPGVAPNAGLDCKIATAVTYSAVDALNGGTIGGTDYISQNGAYPVTTLASPIAGASLKYWKSNATYFVDVQSTFLSGAKSVPCGSDAEQAEAFKLTNATLDVYDLKNKVTLTNGGGANNVTIGANDNLNFQVNYQGTAKSPMMPFGGCVIVEVPTTITGVSMSGGGITPGCPYTWTYAVTSTSNTFKAFSVPAGFDRDGAGDYKQLSMQLQAGGSNPSGTAVVTFMPANWYIATQANLARNVKQGDFVLGIEKDVNADTTKSTSAAGAVTNFVIA